MSGSYDESSGLEETTDSFWEVGNYKRSVKRIDDGHRLCNDLMNCVNERAKIEKSYSQQLTDWSKRWKQLIDKGPQYGTVERAWMALMTEADKVSELHLEMRNALTGEDFEKVKNWQKDSFHKQMIGGFKETKEAEDGFRKAQKPWAKKLKEVEASKKSYHLACKEEKMAATREANSKAEQSVTPEQQKKLLDKVEKCKQEVQKTKEKYEKALDELSKCTPQYMENMEQVFEQCQQFEEKRLVFFREVLQDIKLHLNLTENNNYANIYRELEQVIRIADTQEDLKWFSSTHGPGMPMNWPQFEEYSQDMTHTVAKREKVKKVNEGITNVSPGGEQGTQAVDRGSDNICQSNDRTCSNNPFDDDEANQEVKENRKEEEKNVSSYEKNQAYSAEWSDDETNNPTTNDANGGTNPFDEEASPAHAQGVRVRALYDYEGQEQDELSFKAGDFLTKIEDEDEQGWCKGRLENGQLGLYPANYVEVI
ncbi:protein kinase C and casein kinase substrate in neurons protein 1 isoform X1 [Stegostoma tigrinum]|uniref:protein kinase C and casein kinase substrate in neurons protein 1 isoform X1 n=3 Tax=Stegostoma tigrinum TaxID=3053191 RepID=UPI00286FC9C4|nr:protein kinase C and casein kinase substrate in neurons protein 1 isoform X1 [Stegostoma tigrinum]XP_059509442.1 protein kinase C and casein kinase substrate in neurons protein 1 isoform X1 [Stegostoma tigrinum]XP_059509443.1 protein kinase C and casein kinase substrate in neurons protein 1 isoform X1 [Stegostoma tigrinum]XP_059509444.1 protein kinase C and casein kinase substrate in neurons protein 1 isoform X1 [Stegostoma tigrinum]